MAFDVAAGAYARFMGRYSEPLADRLVELAGVRPGQRVVDVSCGPGVLTARLTERLGADNVVALDPSPPFVAAARERCPGVDVRYGRAEALPFADAAYDAVLANLVVHFMSDPVQGLREMGRVARPDGIVAAMQAALRAQIERGVYLSAHLRAGAVDVRNTIMTAAERRAFRAAVQEVDGIRLLEEQHPPHFHLQID